MMDDELITREDALNAINRIWDKCEEIEAHLPEDDPDKTGYKMIVDYLKVWKYLSAQPERKTDENNHYKTGYDQGFVDACKMYEKKQPERKTGRWISVDSYTAFGGDEMTWLAHGNPIAYHYCSECKNHAYALEDGEDLLSDFCPNCGSPMLKDGEA